MTEQLEGQMSIDDLGLPCGRTFQERSPATTEKTSARCSKRSALSKKAEFLFLDLRAANGNPPDASWEMDTASLGECTTLNIGEFPNVAKESTLSQILQANAPEKYYLSAKACSGILRRAEKRGKELPEMLKEALEEVVTLGRIAEETAPAT